MEQRSKLPTENSHTVIGQQASARDALSVHPYTVCLRLYRTVQCHAVGLSDKAKLPLMIIMCNFEIIHSETTRKPNQGPVSERVAINRKLRLITSFIRFAIELHV